MIILPKDEVQSSHKKARLSKSAASSFFSKKIFFINAMRFFGVLLLAVMMAGTRVAAEGITLSFCHS